MLTVYRHFDSASVHKGALGNLPKTLWVLDYPLLERIYYALVAGFDVYGTAGHQLAVRLYMDRLRVEGESYFLDFLPPEQRREIMQSWYIGVDLKKIHYYPAAMPARIPFATDDPKREFIEQARERAPRCPRRRSRSTASTTCRPGAAYPASRRVSRPRPTTCGASRPSPSPGRRSSR